MDKDWRVAARLLHERHPEMSYAEIGRRCGHVPGSAVWKALNPERNRAMIAEANARRRGVKREWDRQYTRSERGRARCEVCGRLAGIGSRTSPGSRCPSSRRCQACYDAIVETRYSVMAGCWIDGWTAAQIADAFETTKHTINVAITRQRNKGSEDFPHRRTTEQIARIRDGQARARMAA